MSSAAHVAAVLARVEASPLRAHDAQPSNPAYPYVVVYADAGPRSSDREADVRVHVALSWQTTVVGVSPEQCRAAVDRLSDALTDWRPTVAGRACSKVTHEGSQPVRKDDELPDRTLFIATDQWRVESDPVS